MSEQTSKPQYVPSPETLRNYILAIRVARILVDDLPCQLCGKLIAERQYVVENGGISHLTCHDEAHDARIADLVGKITALREVQSPSSGIHPQP